MHVQLNNSDVTHLRVRLVGMANNTALTVAVCLLLLIPVANHRKTLQSMSTGDWLIQCHMTAGSLGFRPRRAMVSIPVINHVYV
jgi:hypothetical protein